MPTHHVKILCPPQQRDIWVARLQDWQPNGFMEIEEGLSVYFSASLNWPDLGSYLHNENIKYKYELLPDTNWNAIWESQFDPIQVDDFCAVRADFHPPNSKVAFDLVINPKMAFGTGHHATTYQMIERMKAIDFRQKNVFDYGCGTGVLAILAAKMGAAKVRANDISAEAVENTQENIQVNNVRDVEIIQGDLSQVEKGPYDIILANINRNVILDSLSALYDYLSPEGQLLISGVLSEDKALLFQQLRKNQFIVVHDQIKADWLCVQISKH